METLSLNEKLFPCTGDFEFEQENPGIFPCAGDFEFERKTPIRIFPCTGDFESFSLLRAPKKKNAGNVHF